MAVCTHGNTYRPGPFQCAENVCQVRPADPDGSRHPPCPTVLMGSVHSACPSSAAPPGSSGDTCSTVPLPPTPVREQGLRSMYRVHRPGRPGRRPPCSHCRMAVADGSPSHAPPVCSLCPRMLPRCSLTHTRQDGNAKHTHMPGREPHPLKHHVAPQEG